MPITFQAIDAHHNGRLTAVKLAGAIVCVTMLNLLPTTRADAQTPPVITEIRERYQVCRALREDQAGLSKLYGVFTDLQNQERPVWHRDVPPEGEVFSEITLYGPPDGSIGFAELAETTPSGDWSKVSEICFRQDGSLAFVFSNYRTFFGNVRVEDRHYFDRQGVEVRTIRRIFDLESNQRLPDETSDFLDREPRHFLSASALGDELAGGAETDVQPATESSETETTLAVSPGTKPVDLDAVRELLNNLAVELEPVVAPQFSDGLPEIKSAPLPAGQYTFLANVAYMNNHDALAAWLFAQSILHGQSNAVAINNLAVALEDAYLAEPEKRPDTWLTAAQSLLDNAAGAAPGEPLIQNNAGRNAFRQWQGNNDPVQLDRALALLDGAIAVDPDRPLYHAHRAEILLAQGEIDAAIEALNRSHALNGVSPAYLSASASPGFAGSPQWSQAPRPHCNVDYRCQETCPGGLTGRVMVVTCKFYEDDARQACAAGRPYAPRYRCDEELPEFGILIPGLNSGFSIVTPWGRVDMTINGAGKVNYRVKVGSNLPKNFGGELEAKGSYTSETGVKVQQVTSKLSFNFPTGTEVGKQLEQLNMGPLSVGVSSEGGGTVKIDTYDSTIWAH